jgi:hypothetical protein
MRGWMGWLIFDVFLPLFAALAMIVMLAIFAAGSMDNRTCEQVAKDHAAKHRVAVERWRGRSCEVPTP